MRHADAGPLSADKERTLSKLGKQQAGEIGELLRQNTIKPTLLISSTALRAVMTAQIIAEYIDYKKNAIQLDAQWYELQDAPSIHAITTLPNNENTVMINGHNPSLTVLTKLLTHPPFEESLRAGSLAAITFPVAEWAKITENSGTLEHFLKPSETEIESTQGE